jgi:NADH dehydrogenase
VTDSPARRPRVVIIGGGFAGLHAVRRLAREPVDITLLDRTNHHLFQPLLYQVATALLAPSDITVPIRWLVRRHRNVRTLLGEVTRVDPERRELEMDSLAEPIGYDYLVVASGARHSYFAHPEWEALAPGLKSLEDALEIRRRVLLAFEKAELLDDPAARLPWQTFVVVGGGPTGVELAGVLPSLARDAFRQDFRTLDTHQTRVVLLEGGPRVLPTFPEDLSRRALRDLGELGVEVRTDAIATSVDDEGVWVGDERIAARNVFWAAGNAASPLGRQLGAPVDRAGRVLVEPDLSVPGYPEIFVAGDLAAAPLGETGAWVPGVAPAAMQMGRHVAENIRRTLRGESRTPFRYVNKGDLATIGRNKAVAALGRLHLGGFVAWLIWLFVHIMYLVGFRNRVSVLLQWAYAYMTYQRGVRLITDVEEHVFTAEHPVVERTQARSIR